MQCGASDTRANVAFGGCAADDAACIEEAPKGWLLPRVHISAMDDQQLFELNVKLQYAEEDEALLAALHELAGAIVFDFPAEAILQRGALLDTVLSIVTERDTPREALRLAFDFLGSLVARLKQALVDCRDPDLLPVYAGALIATFKCIFPALVRIDAYICCVEFRCKTHADLALLQISRGQVRRELSTPMRSGCSSATLSLWT